MPEIKQPEQLSLELEDTRKGLFINLEGYSRAVEQFRLAVRALDAAPLAGAPQPARQREQRVIPPDMRHWNWVPPLPLYGDLIETNDGRMPENP